MSPPIFSVGGPQHNMVAFPVDVLLIKLTKDGVLIPKQKRETDPKMGDLPSQETKSKPSTRRGFD